MSRCFNLPSAGGLGQCQAAAEWKTVLYCIVIPSQTAQTWSEATFSNESHSNAISRTVVHMRSNKPIIYINLFQISVFLVWGLQTIGYMHDFCFCNNNLIGCVHKLAQTIYNLYKWVSFFHLAVVKWFGIHLYKNIGWEYIQFDIYCLMYIYLNWFQSMSNMINIGELVHWV